MRILVLHSQYLSGAASGENRVVEDESQLLGCNNKCMNPAVSGYDGMAMLFAYDKSDLVVNVGGSWGYKES
jgi:hypothetical protein